MARTSSRSMKTILYSTTAIQQFRKLPSNIQERLHAKIQRYAAGGSADVTPLQGQVGFRMRVGDYRVLFVETADTISVRRVGHRREIYD
jgi:mRNA interferase RelE/StbE